MNEDFERSKKAARDSGDREEEYRLGARELREIKLDIKELEKGLQKLSGDNTDRLIEINNLTSAFESLKRDVQRLEATLENAEQKYETKEAVGPYKKAITWFLTTIVGLFLTAIGALIYKSGMGK